MTDTSKILPVFKKYGVSFAGLFGSRAKGTANQDSDYDFLVEFDSQTKHTLLDLASLKNSLEEKLNTTVDLVTTKSLHPYLREDVLSNLQVIYDQRT
jgi:hypothetical protein